MYLFPKPLYIFLITKSSLFPGESFNVEGMHIPVLWNDDGKSAAVYLFKQGLIEEKVVCVFTQYSFF